MTIVRPSSGPGFYGDEDGERRWWDGSRWSATDDAEAVPLALREERLAGQIDSFARAGYRLETTAGLQAVMVRDRGPRPWRTAALAVATLGLALLPRLIAGGPTVHRVVITVDRGGAVRFA